MSRIFGIWNVDGHPVDRRLLEQMDRALAHSGSRSGEILVQGSIGMGCRLFPSTPESVAETQPASSAPVTALVFDGRLDSRLEIIASLGNSAELPANVPDSKLAAACYEAHGLDSIALLNGDFALALFDSREQRVVLARDAIGIRPLYYCRTPHAFIFASEIKAILLHPDVNARPNDAMLAALMLRRLHLRPHDGSTFFRDIAEVPPAHTVVVTGNRIDAARYWDFDETTSGAKTFSEYAEEFRHHFNTAVRRRMRSTESVAVSLSGGVDSSSIFCVGHALAGNGTLPPNGFTYTSDDGSAADEGRFVCEVERHTGRTIQRVAMPVPAMLQGLLDQVRQAESPMVDAQHNRTEHFQRTVQASGATVLLTGHFGDQILFNTAYLVDLFRRGSWRQMRTHLTAYRYWFPDAEPGEFLRAFRSDVFQLMLPDWMRRAINTARGHSHTPLDDCFSDRFRTEGAETSCDADRARKTRTTAMAADLYRQVRSRYHCLCLDLNNKSSAAMGLEMAFPFLDRDLVDFVLRVPGEMLARNGEPKALLREALKGVVPDAILRRNTKGDFTHIVNEGTRRDYDRIDQVLGPESLIVQLGYVDPLKLSRGIASVKSGIGRTASSTASWQLRSLLALEMWLRAFPGNQKETLQWTSHAN